MTPKNASMHFTAILMAEISIFTYSSVFYQIPMYGTNLGPWQNAELEIAGQHLSFKGF